MVISVSNWDMRNFLKSILALVRLNIPRNLPRTDAGFEAMAIEVCNAANMPVNNSTRFALATMVSGLEPKDSPYFRPIRLVRVMKRAAANQAVFNLMQEIKAFDKAERESRKIEAPAKTD